MPSRVSHPSREDVAKHEQAIDISHWQEDVDFEALRDSGVVLVIAKATQGIGHVDEKFHLNRERAHRAGLYFGAYHYAEPHRGHEPEKEAQHFLRTLLWSSRLLRHGTNEHLLPNEIPPTLDLERRDWPKGLPSKMAAEVRRDWAEHFLREIGNTIFRIPILYSGTSYLRWQLGGGGSLDEWARLWIKRYRIPRNPDTPGKNKCGPWEKEPAPPWTIYQWTNKGRVPGVTTRVDRCSLAPDWRERLGVRTWYSEN